MLESIAFIPDGNRRFARQAGISLAESYALGIRKAWDVVGWLGKYPEIRTGTFYTLSLQNLRRNQTETRILFRLFEHELERAKKSDLFEKEGLSLHFLGEKSLLPAGVQKKMDALEEKTRGFGKKRVNMAIGYDGQQEIVRAAKKIAEQVKQGLLDLADLSEQSFRKFLYSDFPFPDLIVRTGDTQRLSGFLTYQASYSELYFSKKFWPDFGQQDLAQAIASFETRERRFGK